MEIIHKISIDSSKKNKKSKKRKAKKEKNYLL